MPCTSTLPFSLIMPAIAPATETGFDLEETFNVSILCLPFSVYWCDYFYGVYYNICRVKQQRFHKLFYVNLFNFYRFAVIINFDENSVYIPRTHCCFKVYWS